MNILSQKVLKYRFTLRGYNAQGEIILRHRTDSAEVANTKLVAFIRMCPKVVMLERVFENGEYKIETEVF